MIKEKLMLRMKSLMKPIMVLGVLIALAIVFPIPAAAAVPDAYPSKTIRLVIPFAPGGGTDVVGRMIAAKLSEHLGRQVVPDNRSGAGGILGTEMVAKSAPDGYTLLFTSASIVTNPLLFKVPSDPTKAFSPVVNTGISPVVLTVHSSVPVGSVKELIALAKKKPGTLVCAAAGVGSQMHLASELFKMMAGIDFKIVQFKGGGPAMIDMIGGHSQISLATLTTSLPPIKSGKIRPLGFGGSVRSKLLPDVPTISEAGVPGYSASNWWGIYAPAGTPKSIVDRLYTGVAEIMKLADMKKVLEDQGAEAQLMGPAEFGKFIEEETAKWGKVVKAGNIKAEE
jgi:tripartite-type tricarboxylate transporter receptor subunit TctC